MSGPGRPGTAFSSTTATELQHDQSDEAPALGFEPGHALGEPVALGGADQIGGPFIRD